MDINYFLRQELDEINEYYSVLGIILIGGAVKEVDLNKLNDLDLLLIVEEEIDFERETKLENGIKIDISYISLALLKQGFEERYTFLINVLADYKIIYAKNMEIENLLAKFKQLFKHGPEPLTILEVDYLRFSLQDKYLDILNRQEDKLNTLFLLQGLFKESLIAYFSLNNLWVPKDKKILQVITKEDEYLADLCYDFLEEITIEKKLEILSQMINYILKPYDGVLKFWSKGKFPLK